MKTTYNYFYGNQPITKKQFESVVPSGWENEIANGKYSYGYYTAIERD